MLHKTWIAKYLYDMQSPYDRDQEICTSGWVPSAAAPEVGGSSTPVRIQTQTPSGAPPRFSGSLTAVGDSRVVSANGRGRERLDGMDGTDAMGVVMCSINARMMCIFG